jgi:uncharacterized membrane protein YfcA
VLSLGEVVALAVGSVLGGALNSVAGGGSFLTFPALLVTGIDPIVANATSAVVLWPASVASALAYRRELPKDRRLLAVLGVASAAGGLLGAVLLLRTKSSTFAALVPWLLLAASLVFTIGPRLVAGVRSTRSHAGALTGLFQLAIALYGGYFGGGMGIVMLAAFALMGVAGVHSMNALKNVLAVLINFAAIATFVAMGRVDWSLGAWMLLCAAAGGYGSARIARRLDPKWVRRFVLLVAWSMTALFFVRSRG